MFTRNGFTKKALLVVASVVFGSLVGGYVTAGAAPSSISICAKKTDGHLRYIKNGACKSYERKLTLGVQGPTGAAGAAGASGAAGADGSFSGVSTLRVISLSNDTLSLSDAGKVLVTSVATDITIPNDATVNFPLGTRIEIARTVGSPTFKGTTGVTVNGISAPGAASFDSGNYQLGILLKISNNTWVLLKKPD